LVNAKLINDLSGISSSLLKYHRQRGHIKGYHLNPGREWLYRLDQVNRLQHEGIKNTRQNPTELAIVTYSN